MRVLRRSRYDAEILRLAVPALGALAADPLVSLIDTAFVGRLGAAPLGSLGVAVAVFGIAFALANFLPYGATPLIARATGAGDSAAAGRLARGTLAVAGAVGVLGLAAVALGAEPAARLMGASDELVEGTVTYLRIRAFSFPAVLVVLAAHGIYRGHQDTRTPLVVTMGVAGVNLVLDPVLIFGFDLGLAGAAWATVAAQWAGALAFGFLLGVRHRSRLALGSGSGLELRPLFGAGIALIVRTGSLIATFTVATAIAARIATVAVAAHQVAFQLWLFLALVVDALAIAGQARVGSYLGAGDPSTARTVSDRLLAMGLIFGLGLGAVLAAGSSWVPGWFSVDPAVVAGVGTIYAFVAFSQPLNAVIFVWDGIAIGASAFGYLAASMVVAAAVGIGGLLLVLPFDLGLVGVWWALLGFMLCRATTLALWYWIGPLGRRRAPASPEA